MARLMEMINLRSSMNLMYLLESPAEHQSPVITGTKYDAYRGQLKVFIIYIQISIPKYSLLY